MGNYDVLGSAESITVEIGKLFKQMKSKNKTDSEDARFYVRFQQ